MVRFAPILLLAACTGTTDTDDDTPSLCELATDGGFETVTAGQDAEAPVVDLVGRVITVEVGELNYGWVYFDVQTGGSHELGLSSGAEIDLFYEEGGQPTLFAEEPADDCDALLVYQTWNLDPGRYQLAVYGSQRFVAALLPL